jgi:uncharacterized caspase-like protein
LLAAVLIIATPASSVAASRGDLAQQAFASRRVALLVSVDEVADHSFPPLSFASRDVEHLAAVLRDETAGRFDEVTELNGATTAELEAALVTLMRSVRLQDTVLVYFSGHGLAADGDDGAVRLFLAMQDSSRGTIEDSGYPLEALQETLDGVEARQKVLVVDACFTAEGKQSAVGGSNGGMREVQAPMLRTHLPAEEAHLLAAGFGSPAFELAELEGSLYTSHLAAGLSGLLADLDGDGVVTVSEAHDFAADAVIQAAKGAQVPLALYRISGREDLVLSGDPALRSDATLALLTTYDRRHAGLTLQLGGQAKGVFPRSVPVAPGRQQVKLISAAGKVVDEGTFTFREGQVVSVERLRSAINGGYRLLAVTGSVAILPGPERGGEVVVAPWFAAGFGHRLPGRVGRHFVLRGEIGIAPVPDPDRGAWPMLSFAAEPGLRADPQRLSLEIGPRIEFDLLLPPGGVTDQNSALLMFAPGIHAAAGVRLGNLVALRVRYRLGITHADLATFGEPEVVLLHRPGIELELGW